MRRFAGVDLDHRHLDLVADRDDLTRVRDAAVERQARDVHQPVDAGRQLDEGAELLEPAHRSADGGADGKALRRRRPRVGREGAQREADAPAAAARVGLELHDLRLDPLADCQHLGRDAGARMAELAHVDQPLDAAEIDERAEVAQRGDRPRDDRALRGAAPRCSAACAAASSSSSWRRETTTLRPPASSLVMRKRSRCPTYCAASPRRRSICDAGTEGAHAADLHVEAALVLAR